MTKVYLHGGNSSKGSEKNKIFFDDLLKSVNKDEVKILCVYFARPNDRWEDSYADDQSIFRNLEISKDIETELADPELKEFAKQIKNSDIIFINGGMKGCLKDKLLELGNFSELIQDKVLVGISAGSNILSTYYYSTVADEIREGIGLLPIKVFTHYEDDLDNELRSLESYKESLPIYKIPEEKFIVLEP